MGEFKGLWYRLVVILILTFGLLGYLGHEVYRQAPPIPDQYVSSSGEVLMTSEDILSGQSAWQSTGGMELGSIWGHGAYQAPDWTADWLHRELVNWLEVTAKKRYGKPFAALAQREQEVLRLDMRLEYRSSQADANNVVSLSDARIAAMARTAQYYSALYGDDPALKKTREAFAMKDGTLPDPMARERLTDFFFWTAWAAATNRPGTEATYTNNWPHEPLIDNVPTTENIVWSLASVVFLLAGIGLLIWGWAFLRSKDENEPEPAAADPLTMLELTPSQRALGKYLFVIVALFVTQVFLGGFLAHYTVEGQEFYGIDVSQWLPYALIRTWHLQTALFWIATAFLAAGLFLAPVINGGKDPKFQVAGVNFLFVALLIVVIGSFTGNYLALSHVIPPELNFLLGHQGYEYIDLGRLWQILLWIGMLFWLGLMMRGTLSAFRRPGDKNMLAIFFASVIAVGMFYGAGLLYGESSHLSVMEYWRWWVVHLWVEGFFEVFATAAIAFIFSSLGLVSQRIATASTLTAAALFLVGGVPGTFHHLYFSGTPTPVMAVGASFSALEVVPLIVLGFEAWENWHMQHRAEWARRLVWPLYCFVAVAFWNMLGAGVFGFMINPPISLYYLQGLNTTSVHAHAALFGVYGFLALGFVLLILRYLRPQLEFNDKLMKASFWALNGGLVLMITSSLFPIGIVQGWASISEGLWYARSEAFMQQDYLQTLRWVRMIGDTVFILGAVGIAFQVVSMLFRKEK